MSALKLALWGVLLTISATNVAFAGPKIGGDIIGNGGGCAELLLRISLGRMGHHARAHLTDPQITKTTQEESALRDLLRELNAPEIESRLVFSEGKYVACVELRGVNRLGICMSPEKADPSFYIDPRALYDEHGNSLITRDNVIGILSELSFRKNGVTDPTLTELPRKLQELSARSWVEAPYPGWQNITALYSKNTESSTQEIIAGDGKDYFAVSEIVKERDPCVLAVGAKMLGWSFSAPHWQGMGGSTIRLNANGTFTCEGGREVQGQVLINFKITSDADQTVRFDGAPTVQYLSLDAN